MAKMKTEGTGNHAKRAGIMNAKENNHMANAPTSKAYISGLTG